MASKRRSKSVREIAAFAKHVQLRDLRLLKSNCILGNTAPRVPELQQTIKITFPPKPDEKGVVAITVGFSLVGVNPEGQEALRIEASFGVLYVVNSPVGLDLEQLSGSISSTALGNAWPYWREFVQSMTTRMGLPPLRVPLLRPDQMPTPQTVQMQTSQPPGKKDAKKAKQR
jgi:hypothetical protein